MKKSLKCAVCGGELAYDSTLDHYLCIECNSAHAPDLFTSDKKVGKKYRLKKLRFLIAILGALYLLYWLLRIIWFRS